MTSNEHFKLLVLAGDRPADDEIINLLRSAFDVHLTRKLNEALDALRTQQFDAVLAAAADFLPLERGVASLQAAALLNTIGEGVCVVSRDGRLLWGNSKLRGFDPDVVGQIVGQCRQVAEQFSSSGGSAVRRFSLMHDGCFYDVVCSAIRNAEGHVTHLAAVVIDATAAKLSQQKMSAIDAAGRELVRMEGASMARKNAEERLRFIEDRVVHYTRDLLKYDHFALRIRDTRSDRLEVIASMGMPEEAKRTEVRVGEKDNGIAGYVAATGRSYICPDVSQDPRYRRLGLPDARSALAVPLMLQDQVLGVLSLESHHLHNFTQEDRQFVEILASYIAIALNILNLLTVERHSATSEITGVVRSELSGPLNDARTDAMSLMDEYIGHDDMRRRLQRIVESLDGICNTVKQIAEGPARGVIPASGAVSGNGVLRGKRVLVADDEELIRQTIRDVLQRSGALVDMARDGNEAVQMIGEAEYHLVLSDIKMPHRNGYEVFAAAKARSAGTAVILITGFGYDPNHAIVRANREGLAAVLFKPFKVNQLLDEVTAALK